MIAFEDVSFRYRGAAPVLEAASFRLAPGESLVVTGPSGCGKSTLGKLATGLLTPTRGSVRLDGEVLRPPRGGPGPVQLVFQDTTDAFNPRQRLGRALGETGARRERQLAAMQLLRLDPALLEQRPARLSGGERQRMGIARALLAEPEVLVLDEPLAQLDPVAVTGVVGALEAARRERGCALLILSHALGWARRLADRHARLEAGCLRFDA